MAMFYVQGDYVEKEYRVRCERIETDRNGKVKRLDSYPVSKAGSFLTTTFKTYQDAFSACERYRAYAAEYAMHCKRIRKNNPELYPKDVRFDNFRVETRDVTDWHI